MLNAPVFRWLLDVENLWKTPLDDAEVFRTTEQWATGEAAQQALKLLPQGERSKVLKFYRHTDAKLCLGSCLLKRRAISEACGVSWGAVAISEDRNRKPCYNPKNLEDRTLQFNVSHHGTLVALAGCPGDHTKLGVDIVRMNWEKDYAKVREAGFEAWANVYEMVFSSKEMIDISTYVPPQHMSEEGLVSAKLRHFYAHWCLKEAYVKMTGEALMAEWLKELEFRNVKVPAPNEESEWGETCGNVEIWFRGGQVEDVNLEIQAFRDDYMVATCISNTIGVIDAFSVLDIERDVYPKELC